MAIADLDLPEQKKAKYQATWERQLVREVCPRHILKGLSGELVARRFDRDEALLKLSDGRLAEVHLTWARGEEPDPAWSATSLFDTLEEWASQSMMEHHREWIT
ncbi:MAG: hypothetical protein PGN16_16265 [Sphingomonas phyllosphaerae]|uniref:hypothetical protein n=1 Tax=Sphingomonas phyllosphaerae TaxID=257003 RepID=UPI002FF80261